MRPTRLRRQVWELFLRDHPRTPAQHHRPAWRSQENEEANPHRPPRSSFRTMAVPTAVLQHAPRVGIMALNLLLAAALGISPNSSSSAQAEAVLHRRDSDHNAIVPRGSLPHIGTKQLSNAPAGGPYGNSSEISSIRDDSGKGKTAVAQLAVDLVLSLGIGAVATHLVNKLLKSLQNSSSRGDPDDGSVNTKAVHKSLQWLIVKRGGDFTIPVLSHRELQMAEEILNPDDVMDASFAQIGGLDQIKQEIYDLAVYPLLHPQFYNTSRLRQPPRGMLLYGKPGTGKTMLAKAIAKEAAAVFLPLQLSKILNKYWGESNKLIAATFSLAHKLAPAVIFIDELDTFLKNSNSETAYMDSIKAEFLTLWDGVGTATNARVLVLGATNKPHQIDPAIGRRMPRTFEVPLPDVTGRLSILQLILKEEDLEVDARRYLPVLAQRTPGYSGSDLKELCRAAAMVVVQERTAEFSRRRVMGEVTTTDTNEIGDHDEEEPLRPMSVRDLELGRAKVRRSGEAAQHYGANHHNGDNGSLNGSRNNNTIRMDELNMKQFMALLQAHLAKGGNPTPPPNNDELNMKQLMALLQALLAKGGNPTIPPNDDVPNM
jgi:ATPase family AAA domain-containing protein 1